MVVPANVRHVAYTILYNINVYVHCAVPQTQQETGDFEAARRSTPDIGKA